jgi:hypothetical protein
MKITSIYVIDKLMESMAQAMEDEGGTVFAIVRKIGQSGVNVLARSKAGLDMGQVWSRVESIGKEKRENK